MAKMPWYRFDIESWWNDTFGLTPNEITALVTIRCELFERDGFAKLEVDLLCRRCSMRPSSFRKALDTLIERGKVTLENGYLSSDAVTYEIISREKLGEKAAESRRKLAEKQKEISGIRRIIASNTEDRIQNSNLRGSAHHEGGGLGGKEGQQRHTQTIKGGQDATTESPAVAGLRARQAARGKNEQPA